MNLLSMRVAWSKKEVPGQPGPHREKKKSTLQKQVKRQDLKYPRLAFKSLQKKRKKTEGDL